MHAGVLNKKADRHIDSNARRILEDRIETKSKKCGALAFRGHLWLALFDDYFLADDETYRQAVAGIEYPNVFDKIILISGSGSVATS